MQMLHGYMIEEIMTLILKVANANITGGKEKVSLDLEGVTIKGEDDIQIEGRGHFGDGAHLPELCAKKTRVLLTNVGRPR